MPSSNAALQSQYSALVSSPRISATAVRQLGLVYEDPAGYGYVNVATK